MSFYNKKPPSEHVYEDTIVWKCSACTCWSRLEFVSDEEPKCPMCGSQMHKELKNIRVIHEDEQK